MSPYLRSPARFMGWIQNRLTLLLLMPDTLGQDDGMEARDSHAPPLMKPGFNTCTEHTLALSLPTYNNQYICSPRQGMHGMLLVTHVARTQKLLIDWDWMACVNHLTLTFIPSTQEGYAMDRWMAWLEGILGHQRASLVVVVHQPSIVACSCEDNGFSQKLEKNKNIQLLTLDGSTIKLGDMLYPIN